MLLEVRDVVKSHPVPGSDERVSILRGASLLVDEGESVAVVGPSGSGKSTLLTVIAGLDVVDSGTVRVGGRDVGAMSGAVLAEYRNRTIGMIFQMHHLLPQCSVLENVLVPSMVLKARERVGLEDRARELLGRVGLAHRLDHRPGELSGGERQRAAVVRAMLLRPRLLLADEPTGALDRAAAGRVTELLLELASEERVAMLVVTHSMELAARMRRRVAVVDGRFVESE
jgi:lipoprotein-releasing system ATP-binding protein